MLSSSSFPFLLQYKLNTDESPNSATTYGVRSIPTIMMFKGGELRETVIGAVPKKDLAALVEKVREGWVCLPWMRIERRQGQ